ncbi:Hypothetical predicted protein [Podarcis lilfordi]|uniref:Tachykinin precursor 4 n=1 Tax=Podarcis lilfordi TaxID=74358 RepID=A0AA35L6G0_9SAUR|nr:Hypothetical predicted protein [Podarcis lilfordi]
MGTLKLLLALIFLSLQMFRFEGEAVVVPASQEEELSLRDLAPKDDRLQRRAFQDFADLVKRGKLQQFYGLMGKRAREPAQEGASRELLPPWAS